MEREAQREKSTDAFPVVGRQKPAGKPALARIELRRVPAAQARQAQPVDGPDEPTFVPRLEQPDVLTGMSRTSGEIKLPAAAEPRDLGRPVERAAGR